MKYYISGIITTFLFLLVYNPFYKVETYIEERVEYVEVDREVFSEQELINYLIELKIPHPHIVLAQARLETGNFTSNIFQENNNLFGMKRAFFRPSTTIGVNRGHAKYRSWQDSVIDFALYKAHVAQGKTENEYYTLLGTSYAEDPEYVKKVRRLVALSETQFIF